LSKTLRLSDARVAESTHSNVQGTLLLLLLLLLRKAEEVCKAWSKAKPREKGDE
jgi:uncharacterized membrane protein YdcZ (DUF606 family)